MERSALAESPVLEFELGLRARPSLRAVTCISPRVDKHTHTRTRAYPAETSSTVRVINESDTRALTCVHNIPFRASPQHESAVFHIFIHSHVAHYSPSPVDSVYYLKI